jgi:hypothetical protein
VTEPTTPRGLGRIYAPDPRDRRFALTEDRMKAIPVALEPGVKRRKLPWRHGPILDQDNTNECTVYCAVQQIQSAPRVHQLLWRADQFTAVYRRALQIDEFPGEADEGTSERAVQKVLQEMGLIDSYLWVPDEDTAKEYLMTRGMLDQGTDWFTGMDSPDKHGYVEPTGTVRGGHEYVKRWYYPPTHYKYPDTYEYINSWGEGFGERGIFRMKADADRYVLWQLNGDLCSPQEKAA